MIRLVATALVATTIAATPAAADFYLPLADGRSLVISDLLVLLAAGLLVTGIYALYESSTNSDEGDQDDTDSEISTPEPAEYYDDQASRARALKRKLDAETELADSYINAKRTRAELDEIEEILRHDKAKRRR
jgi:hypothetical protein